MGIEEDDMMDGVSWRVVHFQPSTCNLEDISSFKGVKSLYWRRFDITPEHVHVVPVDA